MNSEPQNRRLWAAGIIVAAALASYSDSFSGPFIFDDLSSIPNNPSIRHLLSSWLPPEWGLSLSGRPIANLSFALNYALGGTNVWGYHALNLGIHILAGLVLFGTLRRSFLFPALRPKFGPVAQPLAFTVALIWTVHPLQTEAVTYIVQRTESLMSLFYLLTFYCFIRGVEAGTERPSSFAEASEDREARGQIPESGSQSVDKIEKQPGCYRPASGLWLLASILCCLLGMGCKENMASAPVMVLLYDRTFVAGTFGEAWRRRWRFYGGLAITWLDLGLRFLVLGGNRDVSSGFGVPIPWRLFERTQLQAVAHYLWLSVWPHPLVFEYGVDWSKPVPVMPYAAIVAVLIAGTMVAWWRRPALGFLGTFFFAILAPTSLVPGTTQVIVEHRMYLPLAAVIVAIVAGACAWAGPRIIVLFAASSIALGFLTWHRNQDYRTAESIWADTVSKRPDNERALYNLGCALDEAPDRLPEAVAVYESALRLNPHDFEAHYNLATALFRLDRVPESLGEFQATLRLKPDHEEAYDNYGLALMKLGRTSEAIEQYREALQLKPGDEKTYNDLGIAFGKTGRMPEAIEQFKAALRLKPDYADAYNNLGYAYRQTGRLDQALAEFKEALRLNPDYDEAHNNLALVLDKLGRTTEAVKEYQEVLRLDPGYVEAHYNLGNALALLGRTPEARAQLQEALRLKPDYAQARDKLAQLLARQPESAPANPAPSRP